MTKQKSFNPFKMFSPYIWMVLFVFGFVTFIISAQITFGIVNDQIDSCLIDCAEVLNLQNEDLTFCQNQCESARTSITERLGFFTFFTELSIMQLLLYGLGLGLIGFLFGWGIGSIRRVMRD